MEGAEVEVVVEELVVVVVVGSEGASTQDSKTELQTHFGDKEEQADSVVA